MSVVDGSGAERFVPDLHRLADDLRRLPPGRWRRHREQVRVLAQRWADVGADLEGEPRRELPDLGAGPVLADQLAVVGVDLAAAATTAPGGADALRSAAADLQRLRAAV